MINTSGTVRVSKNISIAFRFRSDPICRKRSLIDGKEVHSLSLTLAHFAAFLLWPNQSDQGKCVLARMFVRSFGWARFFAPLFRRSDRRRAWPVLIIEGRKKIWALSRGGTSVVRVAINVMNTVVRTHESQRSSTVAILWQFPFRPWSDHFSRFRKVCQISQPIYIDLNICLRKVPIDLEKWSDQGLVFMFSSLVATLIQSGYVDKNILGQFIFLFAAFLAFSPSSKWPFAKRGLISSLI